MVLVNPKNLSTEDQKQLKKRAKTSARMSGNFATKPKEFEFETFTVKGVLTQTSFSVESIVEKD